eukprot:TRINITY_DN8697_c0_g1_i1.p1 TRINITY_DN8697_c0_g1~~TRINITY_DN8697_c0_g1_i1.p1  ORF type:complete len:818 (+),score=251.87 TRINITY_DN8697_c0_g1_i1:107-2560(+)
MGELRSRRPPSGIGQALGRACAVSSSSVGGERTRLHDEESQREEHIRLSKSVGALKRESNEVREKLRQADRESFRKDQLLQELLATTRTAPGVPGEALDHLREDLQALLQFKRRAHEARQKLEEKEQKITAIQQELRATSVPDMEDDVAAAKMEAKAKASEWAEARGNAASEDSFQHQKAAQALVQKLSEAGSEISRMQRKLVTLQDQRSRLEQAVKDHDEQIQKLEGKKDELARQQAQCSQKLDDAADIQSRHNSLRQEVQEKFAELAKAREDGLAARLRHDTETAAAAAAQKEATGGGAAWEVCEQLLQPGFRPLRAPAAAVASGAVDQEAHDILWRTRWALEAQPSRAGLECLIAEDLDGDGRLSGAELARCLQRLGIPGMDTTEAGERLLRALADGLVSKDGGLVSIADFVLALQLNPPLDPPQDLPEAVQAFVWCCRRAAVTEHEVRSHILAWLAQPSSGLRPSLEEFCNARLRNGSLDSKQLETLWRGLDYLRHDFLLTQLPSWRCPSQSSSALALARFVRDLSTPQPRGREDILCHFEEKNTMMSLSRFVEVCAPLGSHWAREDLEEVALLAAMPATPGSASWPPCIAADRFKRAAVHPATALAQEFTQVVATCGKEIKAALAAPSARRQPPTPAPAAPAPGAPQPPLPPQPAELPASPSSAAPLPQSPSALAPPAAAPSSPHRQAPPSPVAQAPPEVVDPPVFERSAPSSPQAAAPAPPASSGDPPPPPPGAAEGPPQEDEPDQSHPLPSPPLPPEPPGPGPPPEPEAAPPTSPGKKKGGAGGGGDEEVYSEEDFDEEDFEEDSDEDED